MQRAGRSCQLRPLTIFLRHLNLGGTSHLTQTLSSCMPQSEHCISLFTRWVSFLTCCHRGHALSHSLFRKSASERPYWPRARASIWSSSLDVVGWALMELCKSLSPVAYGIDSCEEVLWRAERSLQCDCLCKLWTASPHCLSHLSFLAPLSCCSLLFRCSLVSASFICERSSLNNLFHFPKRFTYVTSVSLYSLKSFSLILSSIWLCCEACVSPLCTCACINVLESLQFEFFLRLNCLGWVNFFKLGLYSVISVELCIGHPNSSQSSGWSLL